MIFSGQVKFEEKFIHLFATNKGINRLLFSEEPIVLPFENSHIAHAREELKKYFKRELKVFSTPLHLEGTLFQKKVWSRLCQIPYGTTNSYRDVAIKVGGSNYSRAVGMANNKNPIPILVPCHRVVGISGKLTGYAFGLNIKEKLLDIEKNE